MKDMKLTLEDINTHVSILYEKYDRLFKDPDNGPFMKGYHFGMRRAFAIVLAAIIMDQFPEVVEC